MSVFDESFFIGKEIMIMLKLDESFEVLILGVVAGNRH